MSDFDMAQSFAVFDAVAAVFEKHLTSDRWEVSPTGDDGAGGWVGPARAALAEAIETSILTRWDNDAAAAEADFEDLRDYVLWQAMLDLARSKEGLDCAQCGCDCPCHDAA